MIKQGLARDENSNAIINTDVVALNKYKQERALHRKIAQLTKELSGAKQCLENVNSRLENIEKQIDVKT